MFVKLYRRIWRKGDNSPNGFINEPIIIKLEDIQSIMKNENSDSYTVSFLPRPSTIITSFSIDEEEFIRIQKIMGIEP